MRTRPESIPLQTNLFGGAEPGPPYTTDGHLCYNADKMESQRAQPNPLRLLKRDS